MRVVPRILAEMAVENVRQIVSVKIFKYPSRNTVNVFRDFFV